jgi:hypothetical protein
MINTMLTLTAFFMAVVASAVGTVFREIGHPLMGYVCNGFSVVFFTCAFITVFRANKARIERNQKKQVAPVSVKR